MASVNKAILVGNLGKEPEIKRLQSGEPVCNLSVATSESWRDKHSGERHERTEWHRVVIFNEALVRVAEQYLRKGSKVYLEGRIETRKWQDRDGTDRYVTEIVLRAFGATLVLLDRAGDDARPEAPRATGQTARDDGSTGSRALEDDEISF
jgi:single-strand DNA-binding protein